MLNIACPHCGARDENEFVCGGESHIVRPPLDASDEIWTDYLFNRDNIRGNSFERWRHIHGCGLWFNVARDTVSHAILAVYGITEPKPELNR